MEKIIFDALVKGVYSDVSSVQLLAIQSGTDEVTHDQPMFSVKLMLSTLNSRNKNGHRLLLAEVEKAIVKLGDRPYTPGDFNHESSAMATSTKYWIEGKDTANPTLWLEGVIWNRCLTEDVFNQTIEAFRNGTLGASFEIDIFRLQAAEDIDDTQDVYDHTLSGWALTLGKEPADQATKGRVSITATSNGGKQGDKPVKPKEKIIAKKMDLVAKDNMIRIWVSEMAMGFLTDLPCPECDCRWAELKKADFENAIFEMECTGEDRHRFEVKIVVKSKGAEAVIVGGNMNDSNVGVELGYKIVEPSKEVENLSKEYTDEELAKIVADAKADAIAEREKEVQEAAQREADLKAEIDKVKAEAEKDKVEAVDKAKADAVEEYKKSQEATAKRIDELHEIFPFESEEAKMEVRAKIEAMTDSDYIQCKADREKDKEIAELKVQLAAAKGEAPPIVATVTEPLPAGDIATTSPKSGSDPFDPLTRM